MKKNLILASILALFVISCSKLNESPSLNGPLPTPVEDTTTLGPEISFDIDGIHQVYNRYSDTMPGGGGVAAWKIAPDPPDSPFPIYAFDGRIYRGVARSFSVLIFAPSDSLETKEYKDFYNSQRDDHVGIHIRAIDSIHYTPARIADYYLMQDGDSIEVNITGYSGGIVNGIFSGKLSTIISLPPDPQVLQSASLTNGKIINLKMTY